MTLSEYIKALQKEEANHGQETVFDIQGDETKGPYVEPVDGGVIIHY